LKDLKKDELLVNVIDYFSEKYNETRSDGTKGEMKEFGVHDNLRQKKQKIETMKKLFVETVDGKFKSFRETSSQELEKNGRMNKRKLNEFQFVISNILDKDLALKIMKENLYSQTDEKSFFYALEKHLFKKENVSSLIDYDLTFLSRAFTNIDTKVELILPACYFGHSDVLKWLLKNGHEDVNCLNVREETGLHLGTRFSIFYYIK
jgi:hypothetical protein